MKITASGFFLNPFFIQKQIDKDEFDLSFSGISRLYYKGEKILKENPEIVENVLANK